MRQQLDASSGGMPASGPKSNARSGGAIAAERSAP